MQALVVTIPGSVYRFRSLFRVHPPVMAASADDASSRGYVLTASGLTSAGRPVEFLWKAWRAVDQPAQVRFELKRVLPTVGFNEVSKNTRLSDVVKTQITKWRQDWQMFGSTETDVFGRSAHSVKLHSRWHGSDEPTPGAEYDFWLSTKGLVVCLLYWGESRKQVENREVAQVAFRLFLERTLSADDVLALDAQNVSPAHRLLCKQEHRCRTACRLSCLGQLGGGVGAHENLQLTMLRLYDARGCDACCAHSTALVDAVSSSIAAGLEMRGDNNLQTCRLALRGPTGKRRRMDPHLQAECLRSGNQPGSSSQPRVSGAGFSDGSQKYWTMRHCCEYQANTHLSLGSTVVFSAAFDGVRVGRPAREFLVHVFGDPIQLRFFVLPPAAPS